MTTIKRPDGWLCAATPAGVATLSTTRQHTGGRSKGAFASFNLGSHVGDEPSAVQHHRHLLSEHVGGRAIQWLEQVHGTDCVKVTAAISPPPQADAAVTDSAAVVLAVMTADCVPILLWNKDATEVAVCHAGWRGLADGVVARVVQHMGSEAATIEAWIGPCIGVARYEVGADVWQQLSRADDCLQPHPDPDKRFLNLALAAQIQLEQSGVAAVSAADICTYEDDGFYSHRAHQHSGKSGECGRFASLIWLTNPASS
ncbi:MAG: peptidoglycan editing factor PgeF [Pseudomonadales bacterium]